MLWGKNTYLIHYNPINTDLKNELKINRCKLDLNGFNRCLCVMTLRKLSTYLTHYNPINTDLKNELK